MAERPSKGIPVQHVAVEAAALRIRLDALRARGFTPEQQVVADGVEQFLRQACRAALRHDPVPGRVANWWRGTLPEVAYANLHAARVQMVSLLDEVELAAEIPGVLARCRSVLRPDDPRRVTAAELAAMPLPLRGARVRHLLRDAYSAGDAGHAQVRSFRNIVITVALTIAVLVMVTGAVAHANPRFVPLCFPRQVTTAPLVGSPGVGDVTREVNLNCPTGLDVPGPQPWDVAVVGLFGLLGGSLTAAVALRKLRSASTAYDVPVALATLKVPLGAFTAIVGLVAVRGGFVPGLSVLDSQQQILAYALVLGFAQQAFTRVLDQKALSLLDDLPGKDMAGTPMTAGDGGSPPPVDGAVDPSRAADPTDDRP